MKTNPTDFNNRCMILGELWMNYRDESEFEDFADYNDIGLPLAFAISQDIVESSEIAAKYINETWDLFLGILQLEDLGYSSLDEMLGNFDKP